MRAFTFNRWVMALLLVSRLVLGEIAHAMPSMTDSPMGVAAVAVAVPTDVQADCPQHQLTGSDHVGTLGSGDALSAHQQPAEEHGDCCQSGGCDCPCMHVPAAVVTSVTVRVMEPDRAPVVNQTSGLLCARPFAVFRPPA